jgi:vacuolar-type H+-ATPase subunit I/STV1
MKLLAYFLLYILIALLIIQNQLLLAGLLVLLFTYYVNAVWLIPLGFFIDGYFGAFAAVPVFSIIVISWYAFSEFIRPRLRLQAS